MIPLKSCWMTVALLACGMAAQAADPHHHPAPGPAPETAAAAATGVEALSAPLREALSAEMLALQSGLMSVIPAVVAGHWDEVARIGAQMRDSYILQQELTPEQRRELHDTLPASFLELDARLHYLAGMLNHVAEAKKPELVGYYLGAMTETCVTCHARYAQAKFRAFAEAETVPMHDHQH
jgi:hypothetical protein